MIFEFGISVHEKLRHFIIVMEKYTKNDGNQNINGFNKVHENRYCRLFLQFVVQIEKFIQQGTKTYNLL